jgi:hypothetical protein
MLDSGQRDRECQKGRVKEAALGGVPERTCSLTSGRTLDGIGRRPEGRFGAAEGAAGTSAEGTALSQYGEGTLEGLLDSRSRARPLVVEDPGGPGRWQDASPKAVRKPRGGWPPDRGGATGGGRAPGRMKPRRGAIPTVLVNNRSAGSDSGDGKPRGRGGGSRAGSVRPWPPRGAQLAGLQRRGGDGPRKRHRRTRRSKSLKGEAQERSGLKDGREGARGANRREGGNPEGGT